MIYCFTDNCEAEATRFFVTSEGNERTKYYLCRSCAETFQIGQENATADVEMVGNTKCPKCADTDVELYDVVGKFVCNNCGDLFDDEIAEDKAPVITVEDLEKQTGEFLKRMHELESPRCYGKEFPDGEFGNDGKYNTH